MRKVAYIDVDDTLVRSMGTARIPIPKTIAEVKRLYQDGWILYCWSSAGGEYAEESAKELGLEKLFAAFLPKPTLMIDDIEPCGWPGITIVHPNEIK